MNISSFIMAFQDGAKFEASYGKFVFQTQQPCSLLVTSGKIVACDPFLFDDEFSPFTVAVAPGKYPLVLSVAHIPKNSDQRIACAMIQFQEKTPVRFSLAMTAEQSMNDSSKDQAYGYSVDSGTGCFTDVDNACMFDEPDADHLRVELEKTYIHTWGWANLTVNSATGGNITAFSSGFGDGCYPSYFGYDECGDLVCLVTDFGLFDANDNR